MLIHGRVNTEILSAEYANQFAKWLGICRFQNRQHDVRGKSKPNRLWLEWSMAFEFIITSVDFIFFYLPLACNYVHGSHWTDFMITEMNSRKQRCQIAHEISIKFRIDIEIVIEERMMPNYSVQYNNDLFGINRLDLNLLQSCVTGTIFKHRNPTVFWVITINVSI